MYDGQMRMQASKQTSSSASPVHLSSAHFDRYVCPYESAHVCRMYNVIAMVASNVKGNHFL